MIADAIANSLTVRLVSKVAVKYPQIPSLMRIRKLITIWSLSVLPKNFHSLLCMMSFAHATHADRIPEDYPRDIRIILNIVSNTAYINVKDTGL